MHQIKQETEDKKVGFGTILLYTAPTRNKKASGGVNCQLLSFLWIVVGILWTKLYIKYMYSFDCNASVRLEKCKTLGFATPVLDLMHMPLQHINNTDHEKQKYIHQKAPIYTEMYTHRWSFSFLFLESLECVISYATYCAGKRWDNVSK